MTYVADRSFAPLLVALAVVVVVATGIDMPVRAQTAVPPPATVESVPRAVPAEPAPSVTPAPVPPGSIPSAPPTGSVPTPAPVPGATVPGLGSSSASPAGQAPSPQAVAPPASPPAPAAPGTDPQTATPAQPEKDPSATVDTTLSQEIVLQAKPVLALRGESTWDDGFETLTKAFQRLTRDSARLGLKTTGRPMAVFLSTDDASFRYEAILVLEAEPSPAPRLPADMKLATSPAGRALRFTHTGAYDDIDTTYEAITAYLDEKGLVAKNVFVEEYMNNPTASDDATLEMNIYVLVE